MINIISENPVFSAALRVILREFEGVEKELDILDADSVENFERGRDNSAVPLVVISRDRSDFPGCTAFFRRPFENRLLREKIAELFGDMRENTAKSKNSDRERLLPDAFGSSVSFGKNKVKLSDAEFRLLSLLIAAGGEPVSREVAGEIFGGSGTNVVDVYISYLRGKLNKLPGAPAIRTVRGVGYALSYEKGES